jgi:hypothetical protein
MKRFQPGQYLANALWWITLILYRLEEAAKHLFDNGGRGTTDLDDPKLTHIVIDNDDSGRYAELSRKSSK